MKKSRMYKKTKTWNPFVGCNFNCIYCKPSFQAQLKRIPCPACKTYTPHYHPGRLDKIPSKPVVFVCGNGDIYWCNELFVKRIINRIRNVRNKLFLFQSKAPSCLKKYLNLFPENVYVVTTLETNRDEGYENISRAPIPSTKYKDFLELDCPKKIVTVEPIMEFDLDIFSKWLVSINPEVVFIGYNSHPKSAPLPEPSLEKTLKLVDLLRNAGIYVELKEMREAFKES